MAVRGVYVLAILCVAFPAKGYTPHFHDYREMGTIDNSAIDEASGLAASRTHKNVLYTHNDSGGHNLIYAIDATNGHVLSTITISGAKSHDWEDIACGPCPDMSGHCIYIADTGGNYHGEANVLYKVEEPDHLHHTQTISVGHSDMIHFSWSESNCETIMVGRDAEIYLISKVAHGRGKFFHIPKSNWGRSSTVHVSSLATLDSYSSRNGPVGGDISPNGHEVIIKMLDYVLFWYIPHEDYAEGLKRNPQTLPYHRERQGESVCWDSHGNGYYTISEGSDPTLYYYDRID
ncbi:uncharacterized protein [Argopecten irradians]|uniref:uncharacterized protein n=1 Tax=Argopecten irradians TaxID=31199 RepID=UPI00371DDBF7